MDGPQILKHGEKALEEADAWFTKKGILLPPKPDLSYSMKPCPMHPNAAALCKLDFDSTMSTQKIVASAKMKALYEYFHLHVESEEVVMENLQVMGDLFRKEMADFIVENDEKGEIVLFPLSETFIERNQMRELMAHERWHHIEWKAGLFNNAGMTQEGTATFVQNQFAGRSSVSPDASLSFFDTLYNRAAEIVEQVVGNRRNKISVLLKKDVRQNIIDQCETVLVPELNESMSSSIESVIKGSRHALQARLRTNDAFTQFRKSPSHESMLTGMRLLGLEKTANTLEPQDTTLLVRYYQQVLIGH
jgi:hypothetical protein